MVLYSMRPWKETVATTKLIRETKIETRKERGAV
jgi:hypothetical protein